MLSEKRPRQKDSETPVEFRRRLIPIGEIAVLGDQAVHVGVDGGKGNVNILWVPD